MNDNELKFFDFKTQELRVLRGSDNPLFIGEDVARILGYARPKKALLDHVDAEDVISVIVKKSQLSQNRIHVNDSQGDKYVNVDAVNESGLYSLIFASKLPDAKKFKRWVTSEVLPQIRKTGSYQKSHTTSELMLMTMQSLSKDVEQNTKDIYYLKNTQEIDSKQRFQLRKARNRKAVEACGGIHSNFYRQKGGSRRVFSELEHDLKNKFEIARYDDLRKDQFDDAIKFVNAWYPSMPLKQDIDAANAQTSLHLYEGEK